MFTGQQATNMEQTGILSLPDELLGLIVDYALPQEASFVDCLGRVATDPTPLLYTSRKFHCLARELYYRKRPLQLYISGTTSPCSQQFGSSQARSPELETGTPARKGRIHHSKVPWPAFKKVDVHLYPDVSYLDLHTCIPDVIQHMRQLEDHLHDLLSPYNEHRLSKRNELTLTFHESCPFHRATLSLPPNTVHLPYWSPSSVGRTIDQFKRLYPKRSTFRQWYLSSVTLPFIAILTDRDNTATMNASIANHIIKTALIDPPSIPSNNYPYRSLLRTELEDIFSNTQPFITRGIINPTTTTCNPLAVIPSAAFPPLTASFTNTRHIIHHSPHSHPAALFHAESRALYSNLCTIYPRPSSAAWTPHLAQPLGLTLMHHRLLAYGKWVRQVLALMDILEWETEQIIGACESFGEWEDVKGDVRVEVRRWIREVISDVVFEEEEGEAVQSRWLRVSLRGVTWGNVLLPVSIIFGSLVVQYVVRALR